MENKKNIKTLKKLKKNILNLCKKEQIEIFKIIRNKKENFSENRNGIFINLNKIDENIIKKVSDFVIFCQENKKKMDLDNKIIKELKKDLSNNIFKKKKEKGDNNKVKYIYNTQKENYNITDLEKEILKFSLIKEKNSNEKKKQNSIII